MDGGSGGTSGFLMYLDGRVGTEECSIVFTFKVFTFFAGPDPLYGLEARNKHR